MSTRLELPDEVALELQERAARSGQGLGEVVARLLGNSSATPSDGVDPEVLARRRELTQRFVSGEIGVNLAGIESSREADRRAAANRDDVRNGQ